MMLVNNLLNIHKTDDIKEHVGPIIQIVFNIYFPLIFIEKVVFKTEVETSVSRKKLNMISDMIY